MTWPVDKLGLINTALALTGDNLCSTPEDGSDEWATASAAYEKAIEYMLDAHDWKQITTVATLVSTGVAPTDDQFDTAYAKPQDCIHIIWVRVSDFPAVYQVLNNQIVLNQFGQVGPATLKYVSSAPPSGLAAVNGVTPKGPGAPAQMLRTFMTALETFVEAGIYQGLHEDLPTSMAMKKEAILLLEEARTRSDQEQPKRALFNSRLNASRRVRRPFFWSPRGWGGTGSPS